MASPPSCSLRRLDERELSVPPVISHIGLIKKTKRPSGIGHTRKAFSGSLHVGLKYQDLPHRDLNVSDYFHHAPFFMKSKALRFEGKP